MADTFYANVTTDQRVAEILNGEYLRLAADRNALPNHPALAYGGDFQGLGTMTKKVALVGIDGYDLPTSVAEGAAIVPQLIADQQFTMTIARYGKAYSATDQVRFTDPLGVFNAPRLAQDALQSQALTLTNLIAGLVGGFGQTATTSGTNLSVATVLLAVATLELASQASFSAGQVMGVLHTQQMADFRESWTLSTSGGIQWLVTEADLAIKGTGFRGRMFDIDWFASSYVPTANAGADRAGGIFMNGGVFWSDMSVQADSADEVVIGNKVLFGRVRNNLNAISAYSSQFYLGATRGYDTAPHQLGCAIITDA